jgi:hypothetical protein
MTASFTVSGDQEDPPTSEEVTAAGGRWSPVGDALILTGRERGIRYEDLRYYIPDRTAGAMCHRRGRLLARHEEPAFTWDEAVQILDPDTEPAVAAVIADTAEVGEELRRRYPGITVHEMRSLARACARPLRMRPLGAGGPATQDAILQWFAGNWGPILRVLDKIVCETRERGRVFYFE